MSPLPHYLGIQLIMVLKTFYDASVFKFLVSQDWNLGAMLVHSALLLLPLLQSQRSFITKFRFVSTGKCISCVLFIYLLSLHLLFSGACIAHTCSLLSNFKRSMKIGLFYVQCMCRNNSLGWCQCEKDEWRSVQKGIWSAVISPYETRYIDVRINGELSDSVTVALEEGWFLSSHKMGNNLFCYVFSLWFFQSLFCAYLYMLHKFQRFSAMAPHLSCTGIGAAAAGSYY